MKKIVNEVQGEGLDKLLGGATMALVLRCDWVRPSNPHDMLINNATDSQVVHPYKEKVMIDLRYVERLESAPSVGKGGEE